MPEGWKLFLNESPFHLFWDGSASVIVFFALSGYSLAMWASRVDFAWKAYYPSRIVRLYGPVVAAVVLGWLFIVFRAPSSSIDTHWSIRGTKYTISEVLFDMTLLHLSGQIGPLWSLQWEVWFSLTLPVFIAVKKRASSAMLIVLSIVLSGFGCAIGNPYITYLPMFLAGVALYKSGKRPTNADGTGIKYFILVILMVALIEVKWPLFRVLPQQFMNPISTICALIGATGIVYVLTLKKNFALLDRRPFQYLGKISFSLYLVHEPATITFYRLAGGNITWVLPSLVLCLTLAHLFFIIIERNVHSLSRHLFIKLRDI